MTTMDQDAEHSFINHELSVNLDSTNAFEGPEKLLEIWFYPNEASIPNKKSLRSISLDDWSEMLDLMKCKVLSIKKTAKMDAFLLSESSMFVFDHKLTLKTCGTTTTLLCLEKLLRTVTEVLSWDFLHPVEGKYSPYKVFYSRRCFMFPHKQLSVHRSWSDEVNYLKGFFTSGSSYVIGPSDQCNHWKLYVTETNKDLETQVGPENKDETLEILMTGLDPKVAQKFYYDRTPSAGSTVTEGESGHTVGNQMTKITKLDAIYDNKTNSKLIQDSFAFTPCGYSANMMIDEKYYYNTHITPECDWSYASFESNLPVAEISAGTQTQLDIVNKVTSIFCPTDFCLTFFAKNTLNENFLSHTELLDEVPNYERKDKVIQYLDDYHLVYIRYTRAE
ncbi:HBL198Wp [Eremothecium sinecaudum]|uniref:S-adenosylmethionine decarboxylase proenzyme n=1 Tax=Eremothecium sinecaudum TaxID=45286 RepID=A0A120K0U5_9SACH|nr:HBL198Wp [Eremothecium sinecaudum]AMD18704.1 HBL198Wp [Eremothecium sinecaudum]